MPYATQTPVLQPFNQYNGEYDFEGLGRELHNPSSFPTWHGGVFFPDLISPYDIDDSESVVCIEPGNSGVVIGYQVGEFIHIWLVVCFVTQSCIYLKFKAGCQL